MNSLNITYQWRPAVLLETGEEYVFPLMGTCYFNQKYAVPGVCRWRVEKRQPGEKEAIYIGEAQDLAKRVKRVEKPSRTAKDSNTNKRLNQVLKKYFAEDRTVVFDVADVDPFEINGVKFGGDTFGDCFKRRAVEGILLALAEKSGEFEVLNTVVDLAEKAKSAAP